jgi:predicted MFS family arabinose efflux permease
MLVWGWRVPFLIAIVTLVAAIVLRYNMPESQEVSTACLLTGSDTIRRIRGRFM